ncbi:sugar ABC transporter ATP-binding protein [Rhodococcus sp. ACS1]|uniref:sugar ABC transporter ATP-binding protein n=1 Tax=Rhodococcus sp. ACS1 TaxID=2028570 RepID=UPI0015CA8804|nr:sugar ABC transporter ATP-binding protein [Rhodococcus sp. ACS1]
MSKTFDETLALRNVDLDLLGGEIHALCGQNGSGKSTIIKILAAYHHPDHGATLTIDGQEVGLPLTPGQPEKLGVRVVHQDLGLALDLTVLDNLFVDGYPRNRLGLVRWSAARRDAREVLRAFDLDVDLDVRVENLNPAQRAVLAIARAMKDRAGDDAATRVLILDEPTAHLPMSDVKRMMQAVHAARSRGVAIVIVTHRLEEVLEYADRVTILRDGALIETRMAEGLDHDSLIELLLGRALGNQYPVVKQSRGRSLLELRGYSCGAAENVDMVVHEGEIVGVTGLIGAGFEDLPYGIFGATESAGELLLKDAPLAVRRPSDAVSAGLALVPSERIGQAGVASASLTENLTLPNLHGRRQGPFIDGRRERAFANEVLVRYDVRPAGPAGRPLSVLSGGNQQKLLMAKWLEMAPLVLLLHEPTQGVDVGSRRQLFDLIVDHAERGSGVLLASADGADLAALCHRVLVFRNGAVAAELHGADLTEDRIAEACLRDSVVAAEPGDLTHA